jgi:hypothetical protein
MPPTEETVIVRARSRGPLGPAVVGCALLVAACAGTPRAVPARAPAVPPPPAGDDRAVSVLSCRQISDERAAIAAALGPDAGAAGADAALERHDRLLAAVAAEKGCR